jgi:hypothetical protein
LARAICATIESLNLALVRAFVFFSARSALPFGVCDFL